jgi:hypothetical protein
MRYIAFRLMGSLLLALCMAEGGAVVPVVGAAAQTEPLQTFSTARLDIVTRSGRHAFTVEIAETEAERAQGLMFRSRLAPDAGMLFIYPADRRLSMWMKNTLIPLDQTVIAELIRSVMRIRAKQDIASGVKIVSLGRAARGPEGRA